jgi:pimeloyl-ACP methyl ester carboxylesterase
MAVFSAKKSTIVRADNDSRVLGFLLALAEREAPGLGARLAVRMWMTIPPVKRTESVGGGERAVLSAERAPRVVVESWGTGPAVYLLHGWAGNRGQFGAFVAPLTAAGFRVIAIDAPGHGESGPGRFGRGRGLMPDFIEVLGAAVGQCGPAHAVVAHSAGASATAIAVLDGLPVGRLALISPLAHPLTAVDMFAKVAGIGPRVQAHMARRIERVARRPMSDFDIAARAGECEELPPTLVVHDLGDRYVPFDSGALVATAWPGARLEPTEGLGHNRTLVAQAVIESVVSFLSR